MISNFNKNNSKCCLMFKQLFFSSEWHFYTWVGGDYWTRISQFEIMKYQFSETLSVCLYIYSCWLTVVKGDPNTPFSIATTLKWKGGCYSFLWIAPLNLDPYLIMLNVKQRGIKDYFESLVWLDLGLNLSLPDNWQIIYAERKTLA